MMFRKHFTTYSGITIGGDRIATATIANIIATGMLRKHFTTYSGITIGDPTSINVLTLCGHK